MPHNISIHPPRAGRDEETADEHDTRRLISIHPPRAGRDLRTVYLADVSQIFQSTRPVRGGTAIMHKIYPMHSCIIHNTTCS